MDHSIRLLTPDDQFERGRRAHAAGRGHADHDMNPNSPAIVDWQRGWRQAEYDARCARLHADQTAQLAEVSHP